MPNRQLKAGIVESLRFNRVSLEAQNLYLRLIPALDDYGRFDAHPLIVARAAYPYGDPRGKPIRLDRIEQWLAELENARLGTDDLPLITRYEVAGVSYLLYHRWTERIRAEKPRYPDPPFNQLLKFDKQSVEDGYRRWQMQANVGSLLQPPAPAPDPTRPDPTRPDPLWKENGGFASSEQAKAAQMTQFAAADSQARRLAKIPEEERSQAQEEKLKKMRRIVRKVQDRQAVGDFTPVEIPNE